MSRARGSAFAALLALLGCAPRPVSAERLAYPVLAFESHGPVVYADVNAFCTTTENGQDKYRTLEVLDLRGTRYAVEKVLAAKRSTPWFMDLAGNAPVRLELSLKPLATLDLAAAKAAIAAHIQARGNYLDQVDGGRGKVIAELQAEPSLESLFARFAGPRSFRAVLAETQRVADARDGVTVARERKGRR
jgi:hypothetical protein